MIKNLFNNSAAVTAFWTWFLEHEPFYYHLELYDTDDLFEKLCYELHKIDENLTFEFTSILPNRKREFTISADGIRASFPAVLGLIKAAPKLDHWDIVAFRQPAPIPICIKIEDIALSYTDIMFQYYIHNRELALTLFIKDLVPNNQIYEVATCILLDALLGEYDAVTKIRYVDLQPLKSHHILEELHPFPMLKTIVKQRACN